VEAETPQQAIGRRTIIDMTIARMGVATNRFGNHLWVAGKMGIRFFG
jgi:hypothetical protein